MTRLVTSGFEVYVANANATIGQYPDGFSTGTSMSRSTTTKRSGAASLRVNASGATVSQVITWPFTGVLDRGYWLRFYILVSSPLSVDQALCVIVSSTVRMDTSSRIYATINPAAVSAAINDGNWHRVEYYVKPSATQANRAWELRLDGATISSGTAQGQDANAPVNFQLGVIFGSTFNCDLYFDDVAFNDDQGSSQNSWPGDGYVVLLTPNADNTRGTWTGGAGGTTSLFDALNNTPPVGAAAPGTNTSQISANAVATTGKFDTTSYTTAGATAGHTAILCHVVACHGEQVATGTKSGSASTDTAVNNTPSSATGAFNYGNDAGAEGAFPTLWYFAMGPAAAYASQPTLSSGARLNIVTTTTARVADCCFLGLYVEMQGATSNTYTKAGYAKENG